MSDPPSVAASTPSPFRRRLWPLFLLGLLGIATLPLVIVPLLRARPLPPGVPELPLPVLVALSLINPTLYLAVAAALGAALAPRLGLVSHVVARVETGSAIAPHLRREAPLALTLGSVLAAVTVVLDKIFQPYLGAAWAQVMRKMETTVSPGALLSGLLYGGITEEIMLRWGVLSLLAWAGWRILQRGRGSPGPVLMWSATISAALVFGIGHLPAVAALVPLSTALVARTITLNTLAGVVFGWLYWGRSLEAAMLAHGAAHVGLALLAWMGLSGHAAG